MPSRDRGYVRPLALCLTFSLFRRFGDFKNLMNSQSYYSICQHLTRAPRLSLAGPVVGYYSPEEKVFQLKRSEGVNVLDYLDINI